MESGWLIGTDRPFERAGLGKRGIEMRGSRGMVLVSVAGLSLGFGLAGLTGCSKEEPTAVTPAGGSNDSADGSSVMTPEERARAAFEAAKERLPSLARVEEALDGVPVDMRSLDKQKLEDARAWIAENRPELTGKDAELAAQVLAIMEDFVYAEGMSVADIKNVAETQIVQLWAMDADGDGLLSDEEARGAMDMMMEFGDLMNDRFAEQLDTDGDGVVSEEERGEIQKRMEANMMPLAEQMLERAQLANWDSDGDGLLSAEERTAGEANFEMQDFDGDGEYSDQEKFASFQSLLMDMNNNLMLVELPDMAELQGGMQAEVMARSQELQSSLPNQTDYDLDGDGQMSDIEQQAFDQEMSAWQASQEAFQAEMQEMGRDIGARMMQAQFNSAITALDSDGDGRLATEEWSVNLDGLRGDRDSRMFNYLYDADRSGGVEDYEVARFMDAYDNQSTYADADLNGVVDQADLQYFVGLVTGR